MTIARGHDLATPAAPALEGLLGNVDQFEPQSARRHAQSTVTDCVPYVKFEPLLPAVFTVCEEAIMARGSKVFRPADVSESNASSYPEPFREGQRKRYTRRLGDHAGLNNYGVNLVRVLPGGQSSARHTHSKQDEFVYVIEGEFVLVTNADRETVGPGTCIGFPARRGDGHHFLNLTQKDAIFLVIGDRTAGDEVTYPDIDLELKAGPDGVRGFHRKNGTPYPRPTQD